MPSTILHRFWSFIEETQTTTLLNLDDASLVRWLIGQFQCQNTLNSEETQTLKTYISGRLPLIRELAQDRHPVYQ
jgi:succinate dehydrogenase flavin-adding protein (antitoxin of CptAB toxin-antitoxin module)